jgi:hypothetical protein
MITRGWQNGPISGRSAEWTQLDSIPHYTNSEFYSSTACKPYKKPLGSRIHM